MLPDSVIATEINNAMQSCLALRVLPADMPDNEFQSTVLAYVATVFRFVATITRSVERAEREELRFLERISALDHARH